ncbi:hypothetical protein [Streptomyces scabiei]|uniref:hypothetical protein n=1 Tax=Streptomyces scabiei TaxID=1930 RepID=UPI0029BDFF32|nr:hypothetical protein [Streptomyces scabiei]MDX3524736.1 hypothetical protein [Streptomyces scabiei]
MARPDRQLVLDADSGPFTDPALGAAARAAVADSALVDSVVGRPADPRGARLVPPCATALQETRVR